MYAFTVKIARTSSAYIHSAVSILLKGAYTIVMVVFHYLCRTVGARGTVLE